jgi:hypothetical protein
MKCLKDVQMILLTSQEDVKEAIYKIIDLEKWEAEEKRSLKYIKQDGKATSVIKFFICKKKGHKLF